LRELIEIHNSWNLIYIRFFYFTLKGGENMWVYLMSLKHL
jgi:hypothetical protein